MMTTQNQFIHAAAQFTLANRSARFPVKEIAEAAEASLGRKAKAGRHVDWDAINALQAELAARGYAADRLLRWVPHCGMPMRRLAQAWADRAAEAGLI